MLTATEGEDSLGPVGTEEEDIVRIDLKLDLEYLSSSAATFD